MSARTKLPNQMHWLLSASVIMFLSSNVVNAGNLLFNLLFSRWMGPELFSDLAFLLTLKLSILGVFNAVQFLVTEKIADERPSRRLSFIKCYQILSAYSSIAILLTIPFLAGAAVYFNWAPKLGLTSELSLIIFFLGLPVYLPLALVRGVAQGELDLRRIVLSANAEMLVRLVGGGLLWWTGFGIASVIFAFVLSLITAWYFAKPAPVSQKVIPARLKTALPVREALPWAAIQLGMVLALDGDVFVAKLLLSAENAGLVAAISLVQRIIFFASFSMAAVILPQVINDIQSGGNGLKHAKPIFALFALVTIPVLSILYFMPDVSVQILFGQEFLAIAPLLFKGGVSASLVTINYLMVVFMMAHKYRIFARLFLLGAVFQLAYLYMSMQMLSGGIHAFVNQKLIFQLIITVILWSIAGYIMIRKQNAFAQSKKGMFND